MAYCWESLPGALSLLILKARLISHPKQNKKQFPAATYQDWAKEHGDVFQVQLGNTTAVIISSIDAAKQLFLGQHLAMNSRPVFYVFHKQVSKTITSIGTSPWDDSCKRRRKAAAGALNRVSVEGYSPILNLEAREFLRDLNSECRDGSVEIDFSLPVKRFALNLSLTLNYGTCAFTVKTLTDDPLMSEIIYVESQISALRDTSKNYSNYIPLLRYWAPMARILGLDRTPPGFASDIGRRRLAYNDILLERLRDEVARGVDKGAVLRDPDMAKLTREELISVSLSMMAVNTSRIFIFFPRIPLTADIFQGADSNQPTMAWAILLLAHRQDIQEKAYSAIREARVLDLPSNAYASTKVEYIEALTKEINRYFSVLRTALPKATYTEARWGYSTIPANTLVFLNAWACNCDPLHFHEPYVFAPERWLEGAPDEHVHQFAFGIGGRMCVAFHLAHRALYTVFLHLISRFHILPEEGTTAAQIDPVET